MYASVYMYVCISSMFECNASLKYSKKEKNVKICD